MNTLRSSEVPLPGRQKFLYSALNRWTSRSNHSISSFKARQIVSQSTDTQQSFSDSTAGMSNHRILKPISSSSLYREEDFRITPPNVMLSEVSSKSCRVS